MLYKLTSNGVVLDKKIEGKVFVSEMLRTDKKFWYYYLVTEDNGNVATYKVNGFIDGAITYKGPNYRNSKIKNKGRKNETNKFESSKIKADAEWNNKIRKYGFQRIDEFKPLSSFDILPIPEKYKSTIKEVKGNVLAQEKLNGVTLVCGHIPEKGLVLYSRNRKIIKGFNDIRNEIWECIKDYPGIFIVGEIYKHGLEWEDINSIYSRNYEENLDSDLKYHIFDCFFTELTDGIKLEPDVKYLDSFIKYNNKYIDLYNKKFLGQEIDPAKYILSFCELQVRRSVLEKTGGYDSHLYYSERQALLKKIIIGEHMILLTSLYVNEIELEQFFRSSIKDGYEGLVVRYDSEYKYSFKGPKINPSVFKYKLRLDAEFRVIGYELDQQGQILWKLITDKNVEFSTQLNVSREKNQKILNNVDDYIGKMMTVSYDKITKDGYPFQPRGLHFRGGD